MTTPVPTQADRDAAAAYIRAHASHRTDEYVAQKIVAGQHDSPLVEAFMRHRITAERETREACARIADEHGKARRKASNDALIRRDRGEARDHESMAIEAIHIAAAIRNTENTDDK